MQSQPSVTALTEQITFKTCAMVISYEPMMQGGLVQIVTDNGQTSTRDWLKVCRKLEALGARIESEPLYSPADGSDLWTAVF